MGRVHVARWLAGALLVVALWPGPARALVINATFAAPNTFPASPFNVLGTRMGPASSHQQGGGTLQSIFDAAAEYWEGLIHDDYTLNVQFGWATLPSSVLAVTQFSPLDPVNTHTPALIQFTNRSDITWFVDPTPTDNSEFGARSLASRDLGDGLVNTGIDFENGTGDASGFVLDMFTTALHEIEHALGFAFVSFSVDPHLLITDPRPFAGSDIPITSDSSHINLGEALMQPGLSFAERRLPSDIDILGLAQVDRFTDFELNDFSVAVPEPRAATLLPLLVFAAWSVRRRIRAAI